jgi:hypothetical protein
MTEFSCNSSSYNDFQAEIDSIPIALRVRRTPRAASFKSLYQKRPPQILMRLLTPLLRSLLIQH